MAAPIFIGTIPDIEMTDNNSINVDVSTYFSTSSPPAVNYNFFVNVIPPGMVINQSTGVITGTPDGVGTLGTQFSIAAVNSDGITQSNLFTISKYLPSTPRFTGNIADIQYISDVPQNIDISTEFTGTISGYGYYLNPLPEGLTLSAAGVISGVPAAEGVFGSQFKLFAFPSILGERSNAFKIEHYRIPAPSSILPPLGDQSNALGDTVNIIIPTDPFNLTSVDIVAGTLPDGLTIIPSTPNNPWYINGTITGEAGIHSGITLRPTNPAGGLMFQAFTWTVQGPPVILSPIPDQVGETGDAVSSSIASFSEGVETYSLYSGSLPLGVTLNSSTGAFGGTLPSGVGTYENIVIQLSNTFGGTLRTVLHDPFTWTVLGAPERTKQPGNPQANQVFNDIVSSAGEVISVDFSVFWTGATSYSVLAGALPTNITLNTSTGVASGTTASNLTDSSFNGIQIRATNSTGNNDGETFDWDVKKALPIFSGTIPDQEDVALTSPTLDVSSFFTGVSSYSDDGRLPSGLILSTSTGVISGTLVNETVTYPSIVITGTNSEGSVNATGFDWVVGQPPVLNGSIPGRQVSPAEVVSFSVVPYFSRSPTSYQSVGNPLPVGLTFNGSTGLLSGTIADTFPTLYSGIAIKAINSFGDVTSLTFNWTVFAPVATTGTIPNITSGQSATVSEDFSSYFTSATSYVLSGGSFPTGVTFDTATGVASGSTPAAATQFPSIQITGVNTDGSAESNAFNWTIGTSPVVLTAIPDQSTVPNTGVNLNISVHFGNDPTLFILQSGTLPAGLALNSLTGVISGTVSSQVYAAHAGISIRAQNSLGSATSLTFSWTVNGDKTPTLSGVILPDLNSRSGGVISIDVTSAFANEPSNYEFRTAAPDGLTISSAGVISGIITDTIDFGYNVIIRATNDAGFIDANTFLWFIEGNLTQQQKEYRAWLADEDAQRVLLVEAVYVDGAGVSIEEVFGDNLITTDEVFGPMITGGTVELTERMSTLGFITSPTDPQPNVDYPDIITSFPLFRRSMSEALEKKTTQSFGDIVIENLDGVRDDWLNRSWNGRGVTLKLGDPSWEYSKFEIIMEGTSLELTTKGRDFLVLKVGDKGLELEKPLSVEYIPAGPNANKIIPTVYGRVLNIAPPLYSSTNLNYIICPTDLQEVTAVYDSGIQLNNGPDWVNGSINDIELQNAPAGKITCDVEGVKPEAGLGGGGGSYIDDVASIIYEVVTTRTSLTSSDIDIPSFQSFRTAFPQKVGTYIDQVATVSSILDSLVGSIGGWWGFGRNGKLVLGVLIDPTLESPTLSITQDDIVEGGISIKKRYLPQKQINLGYSKNYTVMNPSDIAGSATLDEVTALGVQWQESKRVSDSTGLTHLLATEPPLVQTLLTDPTEASTEANRRLSLNSEIRTVYNVEAFATPFSIELGDVIDIDHPRFGFSGGGKCVVVGYSESVTPPRIKLEVWK